VTGSRHAPSNKQDYSTGGISCPINASDFFLNRNRFAIVGASSDPAKASGLPLRNLLQSRFSGKIYPVNPRATEISGILCYPSVTDLPEVPDVAVLMVDARLSPQVLKNAGAKVLKLRSSAPPASANRVRKVRNARRN